MEGHWRNEGDKPTPLILFAIPDMDAEKTTSALKFQGWRA